MVTKDLNLFNVYKKSSAKAGSSQQWLITIILLFALTVGGAYGALWFLTYQIDTQIAGVQKELTSPATVKKQAEVTKKVTKNTLMTQYNNAIKTAKSTFNSTRFIDPSLMATITSCLPADVIVNNITATQQTLTLVCTSIDPLAPAILSQAFQKKDLFTKINYDGITFQTDKNRYSFNMNCTFKEVTASK